MKEGELDTYNKNKTKKRKQVLCARNPLAELFSDTTIISPASLCLLKVSAPHLLLP